MSTKKQKLEREAMEAWEARANSNTLMSFNHMVQNLAVNQKTDIDRAKILAYRRLKKKGMI